MSSQVSTGAVLAIDAVILVLYVIPYILCNAKLYNKAGQPGWAAVVPVYASVVMAKVARKPLWLGIVAGIVGTAYTIMRLFLSSGSNLRGITAILWLIFGLWLLNSFVKSYNNGLGFWLLWLFLPFVALFTTIDDAKYKFATAPVAGAGVPANGQIPQAPGQPPQNGMPPAAQVPPAPTPPEVPVPPEQQPPTNPAG